MKASMFMSTLVCNASVILLVMLSISSSTEAQTFGSPAPAPAPAPATEFVHLSDLFTVAGPFQIFLKYAESAKVIQTLQNQANDTEEGITIFVPKDKAFSTLKKSFLSNLTQDQLKAFVLFHALPHYYSLSDFKNLSLSSPVATFAGGDYSLNFTDVSGTVHISSGWTDTKVSSSVHSTDPVAIYQIDKVLLPQAIFGTPPTPSPAPAPSPDIAPTADSPAEAPAGDDASTTNTNPSSSHRITCCRGILNYLLTIVSGLAMIFSYSHHTEY